MFVVGTLPTRCIIAVRNGSLSSFVCTGGCNFVVILASTLLRWLPVCALNVLLCPTTLAPAQPLFGSARRGIEPRRPAVQGYVCRDWEACIQERVHTISMP